MGVGRVRALITIGEARGGAGRLDERVALLAAERTVCSTMLCGPGEWATAVAAAVTAATIAAASVAAAVAAAHAVPSQLGAHMHRAWLGVRRVACSVRQLVSWYGRLLAQRDVDGGA